MSDLLALIGNVLAIVLIALLLSLLVAPFDSLSWWAGWVRQTTPAPSVGQAGGAGAAGAALDLSAGGAGGAAAPPAPPGPFVVFLSGVGTMSGQIDAWEQRLTDRITAGMASGHGGVMVTGLFPFSASAQPLAERRRTGRFWDWLGRLRDENPNLLARLIDWRNLTQVFVSMDPRYGPVFNAGGARSIATALANHGYAVGSGAPIVLIGYSGGAQVCLGASTYLKPALGAPITIISLGGAVGSDRALESVDRMYHLYGSGDVEQRLPAMFLPSRWPLAKRSHWNRALADGRVQRVFLGDMIHTGPKGYLDPDCHVPDGRSFLDVTAAAMLQIIEQASSAGYDRPPGARQ